MQRTVHGTKITFAKVENNNGELTITKAEYMSAERDPETAIKKFRKVNPTDAIISTEEFTKLYVLEDEIFFKYAKVVEDDKTSRPVADDTENE